MSLSTARLALSDVGGTGDQGPYLAARPDSQIRGLFRSGQFKERSVRSHDVPGIQRSDVPTISQAAAAPPPSGATHGRGAGQCALPSCKPSASVSPPQRPPSAPVVLAALQSTARSNRASMETDETFGDAQSLLSHASRPTLRRQFLLRSLASTKQRVASTMLHYLRRCV